MPAINPFTSDHCDCFSRVVANAANIDELLTALQECGIDVAPLIAQNRETGEIARKLKAKFFPQES